MVTHFKGISLSHTLQDVPIIIYIYEQIGQGIWNRLYITLGKVSMELETLEALGSAERGVAASLLSFNILI